MLPMKRKPAALDLCPSLTKTPKLCGVIKNLYTTFADANEGDEHTQECASSVGSNDPRILDVVIPSNDDVDDDEVESPPSVSTEEHLNEDEWKDTKAGTTTIVEEKVDKEEEEEDDDDMDAWNEYCSLAHVYNLMDDSLYLDVAWNHTLSF